MFLRSALYPFLMAPATEEGALAAISAAIENPDATPGGGNAADTSSGASGENGAPGAEGGEAPSGDDAGAGTGGGAQGEPTAEEAAAAAEAARVANEKAGDGQAAGDPPVGHERDPKTGRFVKKAAADPNVEKPAAAAKPEIDPATGKPKAAPPKADHVNDPIPAELKGRTRERVESLIATTKELNTKLEQQTAELESGRELFGLIEATGADSATFARHMDVLALMCSPDPANVQKAVTALRAAADKLGGELGETPSGKDPLEGHADLLEEVDSGEITRKRAEEIAKGRNAQAAAERRRTETEQRNNAQTAEQQARAKTKAALNALSDEFRRKDGAELYARKHAILVPVIRRLNATLPPDKIVQAVREAYAEIKLEPTAQQQPNGNRAPAGTGNRQPARGTNGAGAGGPKVPGSPLEALEFGLAEHARATGAL
jgi:hypothetical protein